MGRKRKPVSVNAASLIFGEVMWAAGFFDGEGNVTACPQKVKRANGKIDLYYRLTVQINQNDPEVLHRFGDALGGLGTVRGPYAYNGKVNGQPWYRWSTDAPDESQFILTILMPFLSSIKRKQAVDAIARFKENERA